MKWQTQTQKDKEGGGWLTRQRVRGMKSSCSELHHSLLPTCTGNSAGQLALQARTAPLKRWDPLSVLVHVWKAELQLEMRLDPVMKGWGGHVGRWSYYMLTFHPCMEVAFWAVLTGITCLQMR